MTAIGIEAINVYVGRTELDVRPRFDARGAIEWIVGC
jgi:hypothetical protein